MYKKLLPLLATVVLASGCSSNELFNNTKPDFNKSYTTSAEIRYGDLSATCDITRKAVGNWSFSFTEPDYLMGMQLSLSDDSITAQLGDISVTAENNTVYQLIPDIIAQSVDSLSQVSSDAITVDENNVLTIKTEINGRNVIVTADKTGELVTLKCPYHKLSVDFGKQLTIAIPDEIETIETEEVSIIFEE